MRGMTGIDFPGLYDLNGGMSDFKTGFSYGEFSKYNSFASDNGLGDTPIWIEGGFKEIEAFQLDTKEFGMQTFYLANMEDAHGNTWLLTLDINAFQSKDTFEKLHVIIIFALKEYIQAIQLYGTCLASECLKYMILIPEI